MELEVAITEQVRQTLKLADEVISPDANLIEYGLHSLAIMQLVNGFQETHGCELNYVDFASLPTVKDWASLLQEAVQVSANDTNLEDVYSADQHQMTEAPLSEMQYSFWAGQQSTAVSAHLYVEFDGQNIDQGKLNQAVRQLLQIHPMLRAVISIDGRQTIGAFDPDYAIQVDDFSDASAPELTELLANKRTALAHRKLAIEQGQVVDFNLTLLPGKAHKLSIDVNMVAADAPSILKIYEDLAELYEGRYQSQKNSLNYFAYLEQREQDDVLKQAAERDKAWWQARLSNIAPAPKLPLIAEPLRQDNYHCDSLHYLFSAEQKRALSDIATNYQVSFSTLMLTLFAIIVGRWSSDNRFRLNLPLFDRQPYGEGVENLVGDFTNLLIFSAELKDGETFGNLLQRFQAERDECLAHNAYSGIHVLRDLSKLHGDTESAPIVYTCGLDQGEIISDAVRQTLGEPVWCVSQGPMVALDVQVAEHKQGLLVNWDVRTAAFQDHVIDAMFEAYLGLIQALLHSPEKSDTALLPALPLAQRQMRQSGAFLGNSEASTQQALQAGFWLQVEQNPNQIALSFAGSSLDYLQLSQAVLTATANLSHSGVKQGACLALDLNNPRDQVVCMLAILSLGAAFTVVDAAGEYPLADRFQQCNCEYLITHRDVSSSVLKVLAYESLTEPQRMTASDLTLHKQQFCADYPTAFYIADTQQKARAIAHQAARLNVDGIIETFNFNSDTRLLSLNALSNKQTLLDVLATLSTGGSLVLMEQAEQGAPEGWVELVQQNKVNYLHGSAAQITALVNQAQPAALASVAMVLAGTEAVSTKLWSKLKAHNQTVQLVGLSGAGHAVFYSGFSVCDEHKLQQAFLPFGRPLPGFACRIINQHGQDCPDYVMGRLWVSGAGIAKDYSALSEDQQPGQSSNSNGWYVSEELGYYLPSGEIQLCGAAEDLLVHQGYVIERQAINALIVAMEGVVDASIHTVIHEGESLSVAGVVVESAEVSQALIQQKLAEVLPRQLLPTHFVCAEALPINTDGCVDSKALLALSLRAAETADTAQKATALQQAISYIFAKTIGIDPDAIQLDDDFFDSGGDSLLATHLVAAINQYFKGGDLTIVDIFTERTPANLAAKVQDKLPEMAEKIAQVLLKVIRKQS